MASSHGSNSGDFYGTPSSAYICSNHGTPPRSLTSSLATPSTDDTNSKRSRYPKQNPGTPQTPPAKRESKSNNCQPPDIVVLVTQTDLYDAQICSDEDTGAVERPSMAGQHTTSPIPEYNYHPNHLVENASDAMVAVCRVAPSPPVTNPFWMELKVFDKSVQNPFDRSVRKYWNQRRRLFSRFDDGIQLDEEGWFSVTPEQIADYVAAKTIDLYQWRNISTTAGLVVLDAFCGCGGNTIAYARRPEVNLVVCVDVDRAKLLRAANNAAIYEIPPAKLIFIECNVLFILEHCYKNGEFILDQPIGTAERAEAMMAAMPPPVPLERTDHGYQVGGIDMLPSRIGAVFMDPPWGGMDYNVFGKYGYCLEKHMRIPRPSNQVGAVPHASEGVSDGFFDSFCATEPRNKQERKDAFNIGLGNDNSVNGAELLRLASAAAANAVVIYDVPRNTNRTSLGRAAIQAGYLGNCKLVEHYLNNRLKTITAYFGIDWRDEVLPKNSSG
jgi:trimethylguanosine synthase